MDEINNIELLDSFGGRWFCTFTPCLMVRQRTLYPETRVHACHKLGKLYLENDESSLKIYLTYNFIYLIGTLRCSFVCPLSSCPFRYLSVDMQMFIAGPPIIFFLYTIKKHNMKIFLCASFVYSMTAILIPGILLGFITLRQQMYYRCF